MYKAGTLLKKNMYYWKRTYLAKHYFLLTGDKYDGDGDSGSATSGAASVTTDTKITTNVGSDDTAGDTGVVPAQYQYIILYQESNILC